MNQDYIAKNLCVMRNMQNNTCQGNCQLTKKLEQETKEEQKQLPKKNKEKQDILYFQKITSPETVLPFYTLEKPYQKYHYDFSEDQSFYDSIFRPPKFI